MNIEKHSMDFPENEKFRFVYNAASGREEFRRFEKAYNSLEDMRRQMASSPVLGRCFIQPGDAGFQVLYETGLKKHERVKVGEIHLADTKHARNLFY